MRCFLCGRKYDKDKRYNVITLINENNKMGIKRISDENQRVMALCPNCVRACAFGACTALKSYSSWDYEGIEIEYEE